ncbi:CAP domain-containing protein [Butyribacter sp.]|uniref:CAP domain-containing protein n=1 Tax=Butyribacter sp. TaxID=2822465 RepID=UPI002AA0932F|nr:CAP domain-containing protein [Butyribacter sp.]
MSKRNKWKQICSMFMAVTMLFTSLYWGGMKVSAATPPVKIKVTYGQTEARTMLADINEFRTSDTEAWCWDKTDSVKESYRTTELQYDYALERVAMKRAVEIALSYDHTRPNGTKCFTAYPFGYMAEGENIAAGYMSAAKVFNGWKEENESYGGQGHRRNMLSSNFKAVGIGHVVYQGCHYWVQEFGDKVMDGTASAANDSTQIEDVDVSSSYITAVKTNLDDVSLKVGGKVTTEDFSLAINVKNQWGYQKDCVIENTCTAKIEDETIASLSDDGVITGLKSGTTKIRVSNPFGDDFYRTITVEEGTESKDDNTTNPDVGKTDISVEPIADQIYTGSALMPDVVVKAGSKVLVKDVDYTVLYSNNTNVGTASVKVTGKGTYEGSYTTNFKIVSCAIGQAACSRIADQTYTGSALKPEIVVKAGTKVLKKSVDYYVSYRDNTNVGTATAKITGRGNYKGSYTTTFKIVPCAISQVTIREIADKTYSGKKIEPYIKLTYKNKSLKRGTDYTVSYDNNIDVGTATATITGIGNFMGTTAVSFKIVKGTSKIKVSAISNQTFTGVEITPEVSVKEGTKKLTKDVDYKVSYANNINVGIATVTVTGIGSYDGTARKTFRIVSRPLKEVSVEKIDAQEYTGKELTPKLNLTYNGKTLTDNVDYVAVYSSNIEPGNGVVKVQGKGNFSGQRTVVFKIKENSQSSNSGDNQNDNKNDNKDETVHTTKMTLNKIRVTLKKGKTYHLKVTVNVGSVDKITFTSSDKKVATVSKNGVIKAKKAGRARITVKSGKRTKWCWVIVKK